MFIFIKIKVKQSVYGYECINIHVVFWFCK